MGTNAGDTIIAPGNFPAVFAAACSTNVDLTTTEVDITAATVTFTTTKANAQYLCIGSFYFATIASATAVAVGKLNVDGTNQPAFANFTGTGSGAGAFDRTNSSQTWSGTLAAAGSHTLKLRGVSGATGVRINATHTTITVYVF